MAGGQVAEAAFFDLDKTIIATSSTLAFRRPFFDGGLINRRSVLRSAYAQLVFGRSGIDRDQMDRMRVYLTQLCSGWEVQTVRDIVAETLHSIVEPLVYLEAVDLIAEHHRVGRDVVIVSASGAEVVEPIGEMLGADHVVATRLVEVDGRYTGEIAFYAYGDHKAAAMRALADERGYDLDRCWAYSDSETDEPMLRAVGHPSAVNPDRALRRVAVREGWPVLEFDRPVALRPRVPRVPVPRVDLDSTGARAAVAGLALGAVSAGVVATRMRRRRAG